MRARKVLLWICAVVFVYSVFNIISYFYESYRSSRMYQELGNQFHNEEPISEGKAEPVQNSLQSNGEKEILKRFLPLLDINSDVVGWITIPGTHIDYPVVQTDNNDYYLTHDINGDKASRGSIFMDYRNDPSGHDKNTILYGHHMKDGSMFKDLMKYKDKDFFEENTVIQFYTLYRLTEWEIFSAYITSTDFNYIATGFPSDEDYLDFLDNIKGKSMHHRDIELKNYDNILTLSTCTYEFKGARFVVHAKRIR